MKSESDTIVEIGASLQMLAYIEDKLRRQLLRFLSLGSRVDHEELALRQFSHPEVNNKFMALPRIDGVAIITSTLFMSSRHSFEDLPLMQMVHPLQSEPRISHAAMSNCIFNNFYNKKLATSEEITYSVS